MLVLLVLLVLVVLELEVEVLLVLTHTGLFRLLFTKIGRPGSPLDSGNQSKLRKRWSQSVL